MATALTAALGWSAGVGGLEQVGAGVDVRGVHGASADAGGAGGVRDVGADAGGTSSVDGLRTPALPPHVQAIRARMLGGEVRACGAGEVRDVGAVREVLDAGVDAVPAAGVGEVPPANDAREREAEVQASPPPPPVAAPQTIDDGVNGLCSSGSSTFTLEGRTLTELKRKVAILTRCNYGPQGPVGRWLIQTVNDPEFLDDVCQSIDTIERRGTVFGGSTTFRITLRVLADPDQIIIDGYRLVRVARGVCVSGICECKRG